MKSLLVRFWKDESGAQMAEYALLLVLIGLVLAAVALWLAGKIEGGFEAMGDCIAAASNVASTGDNISAACGTFTP